MRIARFQTGTRVVHGVMVSDSSARVVRGSVLASPLDVSDEVVSIDRLLAPIVPTDILAIGLNYRAHAAETGGQVPENPMLFIKASNSLADPDQPIELPANSSKVDYEAELVVVIGRDCKNVPRGKALDYVLGYTCGNDVSARDWQKDKHLNGGQFARGKSFDTFAPLGPWIVTGDEVADPNTLAITCRINGDTFQQSSTRDMIFDVATVISSLSQTMTIRAGAVIYTGTPEGVGTARTPPRYLRTGDVVEVEIERVGTLRNPVIG